MDATTDHEIPLARGSVSVDVFALDGAIMPAAKYICECKLWRRAVTRSVVHAFRTVLIDSGVSRGFLISSGGFQAGAKEAAEHSNVELVTWDQFQQLFAARWFREYMAPRLMDEGDALHEYTEPINSRVARREAELGRDQQTEALELRLSYRVPSFVLRNLWFDPFERELPIPSLPLLESMPHADRIDLPAEILEARHMRPLMDAVTSYYRKATATFDQVFGGRA